MTSLERQVIRIYAKAVFTVYSLILIIMAALKITLNGIDQKGINLNHGFISCWFVGHQYKIFI